MQLFDLSGKIAVVIGGTSGIGAALALGLADAGADVVATSRSVEACIMTEHMIRSKGRRSLAIASDVTSRPSMVDLHSKVEEQLGPVGILVNCAGITKRVPTLECSDELWNSIFDINVNGVLRACQVFGKSMLARGHGRIINIASLATYVAFQEVAAYGASKAAVGALTKSLAIEWSSKGVLVNAIAPGIFPTALNAALLDTPRGEELLDRSPLRRFGRAEELVSTAIYLASDATTFVTGQIIPVDGGFLASGVNQ